MGPSAKDMYDSANPVADAGHLLGHAAGGAAMGLEWAADNRLDGVHSEQYGVRLH
jgi:hypothetical protein